MIRDRDGALYTGVTTDVARRMAEHARGAGRGARSLRGKGPLALVLKRAVGAHALALRLEHRIKRLPKARKEALLGHPGAVARMVRRLRKDMDAAPAPDES